MPRPRGTPAPDQAQRDAAIRERARNVLIDAGAGTGKTTTLVDRLLDMVAPTSGAPALSISRIAALTFTRKAAGELRLKIRERLLEELAESELTTSRAAQLRDAVAGLDTAHVGTIHSFADRLLRLRPVQAELSPSYEITDDPDELVAETVDVLLRAVQNSTLAAELEGTKAAARADEATKTIVFAIEAGVLAGSREPNEFVIQHGLDNLVAGFIAQRDLPPADEQPARFDASAFRAAADELIRLGGRLTGQSAGARWLRRTADVARAVRNFTEPWLILRQLLPQLDRVPRDVTKRDTFQGDDSTWDVWNVFTKGGKARPTPLRNDLCAPLNRWLATRLVRLFPVAVALYEKVKTRHRQLDQLDLLIKLRDLVRNDRAVRAEFQRLFDHIFVDEFQDTDPLQAEIILFLCERQAVAEEWHQVALRPGSLTLVGDPKQSIYRFRRADVAMYDRVRNVVAAQGPLSVTLSANFRSVPSLIRWLNDRFEQILGRPPDDRPFDPDTGRVFQQPLAAGRKGSTAASVHILPVAYPDAKKQPSAEQYRDLEGQALARYLRWLVTRSGVEIADPLDGRLRPVRYGDIAVLAVSTWNLSFLFPRLDAEGIPYASRGGKLFLQDSLNRQLVLGLRALADPDDGVAEAALMRPPFFALDPADLLLERAARSGVAVPDDIKARVSEARQTIQDLRRGRFDRPPGAVARDLLDRTAFARVIALGPNGAQRLTRLRELCLVLGQIAAAEGLDYDATTARMRDWVTDPIELDPPHPVGADAVRVLTVHQAKGLEFPVVVMWDGRFAWDTRVDHGAWRMARNDDGWVVNLHGLQWEEPAGQDLRKKEKAYLDAERQRVIYVAATRARDLLVVPKTGPQDPQKLVSSALLAGTDARLVRELEPYVAGKEPAWAREETPPPPRVMADAAALELAVTSRWTAAAAESGRPRFKPAAVSGESDLAADGAESPSPGGGKFREGRFGATFGTTVHRAIGLVLREPGMTTTDAVRMAAQSTGLAEHLAEAIEDVGRALVTLHAEDLVRPLGPDLQIEYPVAAATQDGLLLSGYVDLVSVTSARVDVIDFKTDAPPQGAVTDAYRDYTSQVRAYGRLLGDIGCVTGRQLRTGLLFSADGSIHWV
jgi:ATP-dependent exoDNAse (exonuclease V) beta subunit